MGFAMYYNEEFETLPRPALEALQLKRLVNTLSRVYNCVPFYRKALEKRGLTPECITGLDDLKRLPFTYKQDMRDSYPYGLFAAPMDDIVRIHASSGTTGKPTVVGYTRKDIDTWSELMARCFVGLESKSGTAVNRRRSHLLGDCVLGGRTRRMLCIESLLAIGGSEPISDPWLAQNIFRLGRVVFDFLP